ncbi:MAG: flagellum-specific peptidoglycan hydrolase FlgJ [Maribacter sp.]|jgi:flagellum-specific peptidoglycan hydrolase FlgJ
MKDRIRYKLMVLKHQFINQKDIGAAFFQRNWMKLTFILFAFQIITSKDIQFSMDMKSAKAGIYGNEQIEEEEILDAKTMSIIENGHSDPSIPQPANTFSNLGFVLNPNYAKVHKVSKRVVNLHTGKCKDYIDQYASIAQKEMKKFGIPASIKLAQGLLESNAGESKLAKHNNNHFGIKCFSKKCKKGHCSNFTDHSHKDFFKKYDSPKLSYRAHSEFLQKDRYKYLKKLGTDDYQSWAYGLKEAGYATDKRYAGKLIRIIEALDLYEYDE